MRSILDRLYAITLRLSAACLVAIALLVGLQLVGRIADSVLKLAGCQPYGFMIASLAEIAGYLLAASSFLALASTLKRGAHIRVTMLLSTLKPPVRRLFELWALTAASVFAGFMAGSVALLAYDSIRFKEVSYGLLPIPLALPQAMIMVGLVVLLIALLDELIIVWKSGKPSFQSSEDAIVAGKEV